MYINNINIFNICKEFSLPKEKLMSQLHYIFKTQNQSFAIFTVDGTMILKICLFLDYIMYKY